MKLKRPTKLTIPTISLKKVIIIGTIIRYTLAPITAHPFDVYAWFMMAQKVLKQGPGAIRPLWELTATACSYIANITSQATGIYPTPISQLPPELNPHWGIKYIPGPIFNTIIKTPIIAADIALTLLLYKIALKHTKNRKTAQKTAELYYLNPITITITAIWGQYDSIPTLFTILSLYLITTEHTYLSAISLLTATAYKAYPIAFTIPTTIYLLKKKGKTETIKYLTTTLAPLALITAYTPQQITNFIKYILIPKPFYGIFGYGLTYWSISLLTPLKYEPLKPIPIAIGAILFTITTIATTKMEYKDQLKDLTTAYFLLTATAFLSLRYPTEQRSILLLVLLLILTTKELTLIKPYIALSLIATIYAQKPFPQYLLPIATINPNILLPIFRITEPLRRYEKSRAITTIMPTTSSGLILATLGITFSVILAIIYANIINNIIHKMTFSRYTSV